jgi:hypothetical protein
MGLDPSGPAKLTLGQIDSKLVPILSHAGYGDRRYFAFTGGYVVLTRIESIEDNGKPTPDRWNIANPREFDSTFSSYLRAVFKGASRHSRFLAFVVTDRPLNGAGTTPVLADLEQVFVGGILDALPPILKSQRASDLVLCHLLVYEFEKTLGSTDPSTAKLVVPSKLLAQQHLVGAALTPPLQ